MELRKSVTAWLYEDGEVDQAGLKADVLALLAQFEGGKAGAAHRTKAE